MEMRYLQNIRESFCILLSVEAFSQLKVEVKHV